MVEGAHVGTGCSYEGEHSVHVLEYIARCNPNYAKSLPAKDRVASGIASRPIAEAISLAINLDDESAFEACKIDCHLADAELLPELQSARPLS